MLTTLCFITAMYFEARNTTIDSQIAVKSVLENRSKAYHKPACAELVRKKQFSFVKHGRIPSLRPVGRLDRVAYHKIKNVVARRNLPSSYLYFNTVGLGKRFHTKNRPIILGKLIFY